MGCLWETAHYVETLYEKKERPMLIQCGRQIKSEEIKQIQETVKTFWQLSRKELSQTICEHLDWHTASGTNKIDACLKLLERLEDQGVIKLPEKRITKRKDYKQPESAIRLKFQQQIKGTLSDIGPVRLRVITGQKEKALFNEYINRYHYLGYKQPFGYHLRYFVETKESILGCLLFSGAAKALLARDQWIGWNENQRLQNLSFIVNNDRFLIFPWVKVKNLASYVLGKVTRELGQKWQERWNYRPVLLETFVDPQYFDGTCYQASNFQHLGMTSGTGIVRKGKNYTTSPKKVFVYPLVNNFREVLCGRAIG